MYKIPMAIDSNTIPKTTLSRNIKTVENMITINAQIISTGESFFIFWYNIYIIRLLFYNGKLKMRHFCQMRVSNLLRL